MKNVLSDTNAKNVLFQQRLTNAAVIIIERLSLYHDLDLAALQACTALRPIIQQRGSIVVCILDHNDSVDWIIISSCLLKNSKIPSGSIIDYSFL